VAASLRRDASPTTALNAGRWAARETEHGLATDTLGRYADTTVNPPVTEAARHITARRARASGV
jgi:hypothetical protein